jgi:hypothetical protein
MKGRHDTQHRSVESVTSAYLAAAVLVGLLAAASYPLQFAAATIGLTAFTLLAVSLRRFDPDRWQSVFANTTEAEHTGPEQTLNHSGH